MIYIYLIIGGLVLAIVTLFIRLSILKTEVERKTTLYWSEKDGSRILMNSKGEEIIKL